MSENIHHIMNSGGDTEFDEFIEQGFKYGGSSFAPIDVEADGACLYSSLLLSGLIPLKYTKDLRVQINRYGAATPATAEGNRSAALFSLLNSRKITLAGRMREVLVPSDWGDQF